MIQNNLFNLIFTISIFFSCQQKDEVQQMCDNVNKLSPVMVDSKTQLLGAIYNDNIFTYNYKIVDYESDKVQDMILQVLMEKQLEEQIKKSNVDFDLLKKNGKTLGYTYKDKNDKFFLFIFFSIDQNGEYYLDSKLSKRLGDLLK